MNRTSLVSAVGAAALGALALAWPIASPAHFVQAPCDFVTAGGFVFKARPRRYGAELTFRF